MPLGDSGINPGLAASDPARALQSAVRRGESFSGAERHTVFRNLAGAAFADVSGVTGLDLPDDGRAACFTDWDSDGDLDLWVRNRGAPGVRFFQNDNPAGGRGLTVKLVGKTCNRDAVGARAVLHIEGQPPQSRSVTAGSGFLAQSSKTLHFGLGAGAEIDRLEIHWPGGAMQTATGLGPGRYRIEQGSDARPDTPADTAARTSAVASPAPPDRTFLATRPPVGTLFRRPADAAGEPLLIALTSDTCPDCHAQLAAWATRPPAGLALETLSIEQLETDDPERLRLLRIATDHPFDVEGRPMPTPLSLLVDTDDRLRAIYRGPVSPEVLARDVANLSLEGEALRAASLPFPGRWTAGSPPRARPLSLAEDLLDADLPAAAARYIERYRAALEPDPLFPALIKRLDQLQKR